MAAEIRATIAQELQLTASAGVAPNKFLAKVASDWRKPNGLFVVRPQEVSTFVSALPIEKIFGVGQVTAKKMHQNGLRTCQDIQRTSLWRLRQLFGSRADEFWHLSRGLDGRPVRIHCERKSLTVEETYNRDLLAIEEGVARLTDLYRSWEERMHRAGLASSIRGHVVKLRFADFKSTTRESASTAWPKILDFQVLLRDAWERRTLPVRLIGLGVRLGSPKRDEPSGGQLTFGF